MKTKVPPHLSDIVPAGQIAHDLSNTIRVMDHVQSGLRQLAFGLAHALSPTQRTPEVENHLASLHEDEARYHEREAAWLKRRNPIDVSFSVSDGASEVKASRGKSSASPKRRARRGSSSQAQGHSGG